MKMRIILTILFVSVFLQFVLGQCPDSTYNKFRIPRFYNTEIPMPAGNVYNPKNFELDKKYKCVDEYVELSTYYREKKENLHISWYRDGKELPEFDGQLKILTKDPGVYQFKNRYCDQAIMSEKYVIENRSSYISIDPNDKIGKSHTVVIETCLDTLEGGDKIPFFFHMLLKEIFIKMENTIVSYIGQLQVLDQCIIQKVFLLSNFITVEEHANTLLIL
jgi:hypothetical protein